MKDTRRQYAIESHYYEQSKNVWEARTVRAEPKVENQKEGANGYLVENYGREKIVSFAMKVEQDHYKI